MEKKKINLPRVKGRLDPQTLFGVETNIRFEIDRFFKERGITIAFPQRDIHIRSVPGPEPINGKPDSRDS